MAVQFQVQFNWQNQGFSELYYTNDANINAAVQEANFLVKQRALIMPKDPTFYIWAVRWNLIGTPGQEDSKRYSQGGTYVPSTAQVAASPWDAWLYYLKSGSGPKKVQEIRGIPRTLTGILGNVPIPGDPWLAALATFRSKIAGNPGNFGIYHNQVPLPAAMISVKSIVPSPGGVGMPPLGALVVTAPGHGIPAVPGFAKVVFRTVRCVPKLAPRHVGVYIDANTFYLKNTNEGQLTYQGGGLMYLFNPTVIVAAQVVNQRSSIRKVGRPWGTMKARRLHTV